MVKSMAKNALAALLGAALVNVCTAQTELASIVPVGFQDDGLTGEIIGTGTDGTTYVLSGTFASLDIPVTVTLIEGPTTISETANLVTAGATAVIDVQCGVLADIAVCSELVSAGTLVSSFFETGSLDPSLILVTFASGATASVTQSTIEPTSTTSVGLSTSSSVSLLPPVLSSSTTSSTPTLPGSSTSVLAPTLNPTTSSGALPGVHMSGVGAGLVGLGLSLSLCAASALLL